jgi:hypothetical protein
MSYSSTAKTGGLLSTLGVPRWGATTRRSRAETRFDSQTGQAGAAPTERATSRLGRAAASRGLPIPGSVARQMEPDCRLTAWTTHPSSSYDSISMRVRVGVDASNRARRSVLSQLARDIPQATASDVRPLRLEPRIVPPDPESVSGIGLFLVNELSEAWGVARDGAGRTRVDSETASVAPS